MSSREHLERERLAVIPSRGGSKRIPRKNIRLLAGRPMIAYTIEAACESGVFDRVIVSTDDEETAQLAAELGCDVPFLRDPKLADDHSPVSAATVDALERLDPRGERYAVVAQLLPNCPLRTAEDVRASLRHFAEGSADVVLSVCRYGWLNPWWAMTRDDAGRLHPMWPEQMQARSQDQPEPYCPTGAIWWGRSSVVREHGTFHIDGRAGWVMPWEHGIDIDTDDDWRLAEALIASGHQGRRTA